MNTIDYPPYATITWHEDLRAVEIKWLKLHMKLSEFQEIAGKAFEVLIENKGYVWVANMYESTSVFSKDITNYISDEKTTEASKAVGLRWALTIMPKGLGLASMSTKSWNKDVEASNTFVVEQFPDWDTCSSWIKQQQSTVSA